MIKAIIFDLDDTLYEERAFVESGFKAVSHYMKKQFGVDNRQFFNVLMDLLEKQGRGRNFDIALINYNLYDKKLVPKLVEVYRSHKPSIKPYPEVKNTLQALRNNKFLLGLITDGFETVQQNKVQSLGIESLFDLIVYTDKLGKYAQKPSKYPYEVMLRHFGVAAEEVIYVGDNPCKDFIGAKELGLKSVRVLKGEHKDMKVSEDYEADCSIRMISELPQLINKWQTKDRKTET